MILFAVTRTQQLITPKPDVIASPPVAPGTTDIKMDLSTVATISNTPAAATAVIAATTTSSALKEIPISSGDVDADEVIPDDLSEISDDADEILNRQEVRLVFFLLDFHEKKTESINIFLKMAAAYFLLCK